MSGKNGWSTSWLAVDREIQMKPNPVAVTLYYNLFTGQLRNSYLYVLIVYLTGGTFNPAIAASQPSGKNGTHLCGVVDGQPRFHRDPKQPDNHRYAQSFASNLNIGEPYTVRLIYFLPRATGNPSQT